MRTTIVSFAIAVIALFAGCASVKVADLPPGTFTSCDNHVGCLIPVSVVGCNVTIPADKQAVVMNGNFVAILWQLDPDAVQNKYRFDSSAGVILKDSTPDTGHWYTGKQFSGQMPIAQGISYFWIDRNSDWNEYRYTINIVDGNNGNKACKPLDPKVVNN